MAGRTSSSKRQRPHRWRFCIPRSPPGLSEGRSVGRGYCCSAGCSFSASGLASAGSGATTRRSDSAGSMTLVLLMKNLRILSITGMPLLLRPAVHCRARRAHRGLRVYHRPPALMPPPGPCSTFLKPGRSRTITGTAHVAALIKTGWRDRPFEAPATCPHQARCQFRSPGRREEDESASARNSKRPTAELRSCLMVCLSGRMVML